MIEQHEGSASTPNHGNRNMKDAWQDPFPIYKAYMQRFEAIRSRLPEDLQTSEGMKWLRIGARIHAGMVEFGTGVADLVWDTVTLPVNAFGPEIRHRFFNKTLLAAKSPDVVGETKDMQGNVEKIMLWITGGGQFRFRQDMMRQAGAAHHVDTSASDSHMSGGAVPVMAAASS